MNTDDVQGCPPAPLAQRRVLLGVCGSVAAYKGAEICRQLVHAGAQVQVVMTAGATRFVTPLTFQALSGRPVATEMFAHELPGDAMQHISLARDSDLVVVAPASADLIARAAGGRADDLLSCILLASGAPVLVAPAMNPAMWAHPMTRDNVSRLKELADYRLVGPVSGVTACGEEGPGRMSEPAAVAEAAIDLLGS